MASRNFNYTGRMLITQECIDARLSEIQMAKSTIVGNGIRLEHETCTRTNSS